MRPWGVSGKRGHYSGPSGPSGHKVSRWEAGRFVAWDGEGMCPRGCDPGQGCDHPQDYGYLANSEGGELVEPNGIPTLTALHALTGEAARLGGTVTHVCFGLSYDANQMLRDLPRSQIRRIWEGQRVRIARRFKIAYRPRKSFWVKDYSTGNSLTIWDVFGFYQAPFVRAVEDNLGRKDPRLSIIREGKKRRGTFAPGDLPMIRRYTGAELSALVDLCGHLRTAFDRAGLQLTRWDGAGAAASALLTREGVKEHLIKTPSEIAEAALYAYFGGRIETRMYGFHQRRLFHGDLRSAYPWGATLIPSLAYGRWKHTGRGSIPDETLSVVRVRWDYRRLGDRWDLLPFPFRSASGAVYFPRRGETWVWRPEAAAAMAVPEIARKTQVVDSWAFVPDGDRRPFAFLERIYKERKRLKDAKDEAQKALKLSSNSVYGKLAQNVGGTEERPPPFHQLEYAGFITSAVRARLWTTALNAPTGAVTIATDGIYSTEPLGLVDSDELGGWEVEEPRLMVIAQSGVYWFLKPTKRSEGCERCGGAAAPGPLGSRRCVESTCGWSDLVSHFRGFDEDTLDPNAILNAWRRGKTSVPATSTRFVTMGRASLTDKGFKDWRRWVTEARVLEVRAQGKRVDRERKPQPHKGLVATDPAPVYGTISTPYQLGWAAERGEEAATAQEEASIR